MIVNAEDRAEPPEERRQSTLTALIIVVDVNDNSPVFDTRWESVGGSEVGLAGITH